MRCTNPRTVGFKADGRSLAWRAREASKEFAAFQLPCGKCIACRLDYARQWAIRCVHEASMHEKNSFVTLTYSQENLKSPKLVYEDFQLFMKRLRRLQDAPMGVFVTGEYGDQGKRPHWHAIVFNWAPSDALYKYSNARGDKVYESDTLTRTWGHGIAEFGSVTFHSAGYCARYAAKKLVHGLDGKHDLEPISKKSQRNAIGKKWLEANWPDVFNHGRLVLRLPDGSFVESGIPRYYEKWFKDKMPDEWLRYVTRVKSEKMAAAAAKSKKEWDDYWAQVYCADGRRRLVPNPNQREKISLDAKFKMLQAHLKL